ncbi:MAG: rhomboid family intramembrane serine protease [Chitinophagales bacterium]|nr:rhomboid family intramembrane serine protease [Chitinophagales bacterium]
MVIWLIKIIEIAMSANFAAYGILPKQVIGLRGILFSPLIHGDFRHLISNSLPLLILGTILFNSYKEVAWKIIMMAYFLVGGLVWLTATGSSIHIGASGVVYGLAFFLLASGIFRKDRESIGIALVVTLLYGGLIWGILPVQAGISWESHLYGAVVGIVTAFYYRKIGERKEDASWYDLEIDEVDEHLPFFELLERKEAEDDEQRKFLPPSNNPTDFQ